MGVTSILVMWPGPFERIKRTDGLTMMLADTDASTNLGINENTTLLQFEDVVSTSENNNSNNTVSEVKNAMTEPRQYRL